MRYNAYLRDMNIGVSSGDERRVEVLAQDLPCFGGAQLAVDVTLVSALCSSGEPQPHAAEVDGVVLERARHVKEATYPELAASERCRLVVLAIETGGRWSEEQCTWFDSLPSPAHGMSHGTCHAKSRGLGSDAGHACWPLHAQSPSQPPWWSHPSGATLGATQAARHQDSLICWIRGSLSEAPLDTIVSFHLCPHALFVIFFPGKKS